MLQRKQSLFLLIAFAAVIVSMILPLWSIQIGDIKSTLSAFSLDSVHISNAEPAKNLSFGYLGGIQVVTGLLLLITIFRFRNRKSQVKLGWGAIALQAIVLSMTFFMEIPKAKELLEVTEPGDIQAGIFLPIVAIVLVLVANVFIKKDEKLVRSVDRIR